MDSITRLGMKNLIQGGVPALLDELASVVALERKYTITSNGEALEAICARKGLLILHLRQLLGSGYVPHEEERLRIDEIHRENQANMKLFHSIIKLINGYKNILKDMPIETGTYSNKGAIEKQSISIRFNGTA